MEGPHRRAPRWLRGRQGRAGDRDGGGGADRGDGHRHGQRAEATLGHGQLLVLPVLVTGGGRRGGGRRCRRRLLLGPVFERLRGHERRCKETSEGRVFDINELVLLMERHV